MKKRLDEKAQRTIVKKLEAVGQETAVLCKELADLSTPQKRRDIIMACLTELVVAHARLLGLTDAEVAEIDEQTGRDIEARRLAEVTGALNVLDKSGNSDAQAFGRVMRESVSAKLRRGVKGSG